MYRERDRERKICSLPSDVNMYLIVIDTLFAQSGICEINYIPTTRCGEQTFNLVSYCRMCRQAIGNSDSSNICEYIYSTRTIINKNTCILAQAETCGHIDKEYTFSSSSTFVFV